MEVNIFTRISISGNYKVEMFDEQKNAFVPTLVGLGMLVQVKDPDDKELLSRVMITSLQIAYWYCVIFHYALISFCLSTREV